MEDELMCYTFHANYNPISEKETEELICIKMPAHNKKEAIMKLRRLIIGAGKIKPWRLDDVDKY